MEGQLPRQPDVTVRFRYAINKYLGQDFPPGPHFVPMYLPINLQKGGTLPFCLFLMWYYQNYSTAAYFYTATHGAYGLVWLLKHCAFGDAQWNTKVTLGGAVWMVLLVLGPYWLAPWLLMSRTAPAAGAAQCAAGCLVSVVGQCVMMASDAQKTFTLAHKKGLITSGMFRYVRHPNYTGEMMVYGGFALMVAHWAPWAVLAWVWVEVFHTNMMRKEARMSRHAGWDAWYARTGMVLPWLPALLCGGGGAGAGEKKA